MTNKKSIIIDYDGTLVNSQHIICDMYNQYYKQHDQFVPAYSGTTHRWDMSDILPLIYDKHQSDRKWTHVNQMFNDKQFFQHTQQNYFAEALVTIYNWHKAGHHIAFCTVGSPTNCQYKIKELSILFSFANIITLTSGNGVIPNKNRINMANSILIDDRIDTLINSNAQHKILFHHESYVDTFWNTVPDNMINDIYVVRNWHELAKLIDTL